MSFMKRRIAIICGGDSSEYAVSMRSGEGLFSFFDKEKYDVRIVELRHGRWMVHLADERAEIDLNDFSYSHLGEKCGFDYAYITVHGSPGENGIMQGYFDLIGMPYSTGSVLVEALTFDKFALNNHLRAFGISVADSVLVRKGEPRAADEEIIARIGLPCFVKPAADGSSYGVSKVKTAAQLPAAIDFAFKESDEVMIEQFLCGTEISQGVFRNGRDIIVLPATEVVTGNEFFDYDAKYNGQVEEITPARIAPDTANQAAAMTRKIYELLHCNGIIRIDYIITKDARGNDKINLLEVNTTPGMTATSFIPQQVRAAKLDIKDVLTAVVENSFK
ncbi:MAG: D-alanine--D-alanine ligase [Prevotella sp.]|nr:D-alanine--D-alanine ligase [Prevotella sp.]